MLDLFSDLILLTAGLGVLIFWIVVFIAVGIEVYDMLTEEPEEED